MTPGQICAPWVSITINGLKALQPLDLYRHPSSEVLQISGPIVGQCGNEVAAKRATARPYPTDQLQGLLSACMICSVLYNYSNKQCGRTGEQTVFCCSFLKL